MEAAMKMRKGSLIKLDAVVEMALLNPQFREDLAHRQAEALADHGISLSTDEQEALSDLIEGTSCSALTDVPAGEKKNRFDRLRQKWSQSARASS